MTSQPTAPISRAGTPGLDIFKIAGQSISGFIPSFKTNHPRHIRQPFTSLLEERLALYLEYHPHVVFYQRGDVSPAFANANRLIVPLGTPYRISYIYQGKPHEYLPDFVGTLSDGTLLIAEAGRESEKRTGKPVAKAEAAERLAQLKGGVYWIGTDENLSDRRHYNLLFLHARRRTFATYEQIYPYILEHLIEGEPKSVNDLVGLLGSQWSKVEVAASVWKLVGDSAAAGHLLIDLEEIVLDQATPLMLLEPTAPPILPPPLPSSLLIAEAEREAVTVATGDSSLIEPQAIIPGPTIDASALSTEKYRKRFHRNLTAVMEVLNGASLRAVAKTHSIAASTLSRLVSRSKEYGQIACVPHKTYKRDRELRPEFQELIRKLYTRKIRPSVTAVCEDIAIKELAEELGKIEGTPVPLPSYWQVWHYIQAISQEESVVHARSGLKHSPRERMSTKSFILSITAPGLITQVDEHTIDLKICTPDGIVVTRRVHGAVLICVKTSAILAAVLSLDTLTEEDYMRLIKQALEPKDKIVALYECKRAWPCQGKTAVVLHDRGKIFTSERAIQVLVERLGIVTEQAPPFAPSVKGTVEALFAWMVRKFEHRLPGTTKSSPADRGTYDSEGEAEKAGITFDVLEKLFTKAIVDDYMQEWDKLRRQKRITLWEQGVQQYGVPQWMGSQDDLKLLLMKAVNRKNPATGRYAITPQRGLSFLGYRYVSPGLMDRLRGQQIDIYYDRRDISVIYLFLEGELIGEAYCPEFMGRRVSIWEARAMRKADKEASKPATAISLEGRQEIQKEAQSGRAKLAAETKRIEKQRQLDIQRPEMHPDHVRVTLEMMQQEIRPADVPAKRSILLSPAKPNDEGATGIIRRLHVRKREIDHE
jgi:transposase